MEHYNLDCREFKGNIPCKPIKNGFSKGCVDCKSYNPFKKRVLIINFGAIGEVIRSTSILYRLKDCEVYWLTNFPDAVPKGVIVFNAYDYRNIIHLLGEEFDLLINLDKDTYPCSIAGQIKAKEKRGFILNKGRCYPLPGATHKWREGIDDAYMQASKKHYVEEIYELCGWKWQGEGYFMPEIDVDKISLIFKEKFDAMIDKARKQGKKIILLNSTTGDRWGVRKWSEKKWDYLGKLLIKQGDYPLYVYESKGFSEVLEGIVTTHNLHTFFYVVSKCDVVVTGITMALHAAIGLGKPVVTFNNAFNPDEFHLYDKGTLINVKRDCIGCYKVNCQEKCLEDIMPNKIVTEVNKWK